MAEEAAQIPGQDPSQPAASVPADPPQQPVAPQPTASEPAQPGPGPWQNDLQQAFDPETAAKVDAFLRSTVQPRMTQLEQSNVEARQLYEAFQADPYAADIAINRQLYGDDYANQVAQSIGRPDLVVGGTAPQPAAPYQPVEAAPTQPAAPQQGDPRYEEMYAEWSEQRQQDAYDKAKAEFLSDPQYADINPALFDPFVSGAETWGDAVNSYRSYAAQFQQSTQPEPGTPDPPPPAMGSETQGGLGSTPAQPKESLDEAIENYFAEQKPAPPTLG